MVKRAMSEGDTGVDVGGQNEEFVHFVWGKRVVMIIVFTDGKARQFDLFPKFFAILHRRELILVKVCSSYFYVMRCELSGQDIFLEDLGRCVSPVFSNQPSLIFA